MTGSAGANRRTLRRGRVAMTALVPVVFAGLAAKPAELPEARIISE